MVGHFKLESWAKLRNKLLGKHYLTVRSKDLGVWVRKQFDGKVRLENWIQLRVVLAWVMLDWKEIENDWEN